MRDGLAKPGRAGSLISFIDNRSDISKRKRKVWKKYLRRAFGSSSKKTMTHDQPALKTAQRVLAGAIFRSINPKKSVEAARLAYQGVKAGVPPAAAVYYQLLRLESRSPQGRMLNFAFRFPDYYTVEFAPELILHWDKALEEGTLSDNALEPSIESLKQTQALMRPLLLSKLRTLCELEKRIINASGKEKERLEQDSQRLSLEISSVFRNVAQRPEVLNPKRPAFDRFQMQAEVMEQKLSQDDLFLAPSFPFPPPRPVPQNREPMEAPAATGSGQQLSEPVGLPPAPPPPAQVRPGGRVPVLKPDMLNSLEKRYRVRLEETYSNWIGTPFRWGGSVPQLGVEAAGLVRALYREGFAVPLPIAAKDQSLLGETIRFGKWKAGDLVFFDTYDQGIVDHVGVYISRGEFIHVHPMKGVVREKIRRYRGSYFSSRRILFYPKD
ncbi:MAG: C40 family peptidase [Myxococcota bacterium]|nr:C40 family peptidase [Myxococcota bacterium]